MKLQCILIISFLCLLHDVSAQSINGRIVEAKTQEGIPFVTVQLGDNYGVISNEEGYFVLKPRQNNEKNILIFSSMGFESLEIPLSDFKNDQIVILSPSTYELDEVLLFDKKLTVEDILERFNAKRKENHSIDNSKIQMFSRYNDNYKANIFDVDVEKASFMSKSERKQMNTAMQDLGEKITTTPSVYYQERLADILVFEDTLFTDHKKALNLINRDKTFNTDEIQDQVFLELLSTLKSPHSFKVRTGIIPLGKDISLSELIEDMENDQQQKNVPDTLKNKSTYRAKSYKRYATNFSKDFITTPKYYEYELVGVTKAYGQPCYHLRFKPDRRKGKYVGDLYINTQDFGMVSYKYDLEEGKKAMNVNLKFVLGIKVNTFIDSGFFVFSKSDDNRYFPKYIKRTDGNYAYINRSVMFKENNPERSDRKKLKLEFELEYDLIETTEYVGVQSEPASLDLASSLSADDYILIDEQSTYNPSYWDEYNILEATQAIKTYE
jgi:hypothetical protein